jgi:hypothetical protein
VRTTTSHGILYEANLTLTVTDLRPVYETLKFRDNEWVEITESLPTTPSNVNPPSLPSFASQSHPPGSDPSSEPQIPEIGPAEELRVLAALHRIGADLGEPIEIERNDKLQRIIVTGLGIDETRQADIRGALAALPGVNLQFVEPSAVRVPAEESARNTPRPPAGGSALVSELEQKMGRAKDARAIMDRVLDQSDSSLVRAHALDKLARRFPVSVETGLAPPDRQILTELWVTHIRAIENSRNVLVKDISTLLGPAAMPGARHPCSSWQECTPQFLKTSQELDQVLTRSLAGSDGSAESLGSEVRRVFARWVLALESYSSVPGR